MNYTPIGRVRPIHRGAHDPSAAYAALDVVRREDGFASYMARRDVPAGTPLADGAYWGLLSDGGLKAVADASCPAFEECGGAAVCHPVAGYPLEVATLIAPKQAGDGEPSPDNLRRISGWTGAKLTRCGKNLAKSMNSPGDTSIYFVSLFIDADLKPSTTYTLSFVGTAGNKVYINEHITTEFHEIYMSGGRESITFTTKSVISTDNYEQYNSSEKGWIILKNAGDLSTPTVFTDVQLELGSTDTGYEPYQGDTYTADFGQTVYGGTLDWNTGVLTVDRGFYTFDGSEAFIHADGANPYAYALFDFFPGAVSYDWTDIADAYCSHYIASSIDHVYSITIARFAIFARGNLAFSSPTHADVDAFKSYLAAQHAAGTPVQVCYRLATPTTIQLSPVQIAALAGTNTLYTDCGDTRAAGRSDMTWVTQGILDRLAALEAAAVSE